MKKQAYAFREGLRDGIPIGLGYLSVSFGIGIAAVAAGLSPLIALIISMTNETSAGQKAGLDIIVACGHRADIRGEKLSIGEFVALSDAIGEAIQSKK